MPQQKLWIPIKNNNFSYNISSINKIKVYVLDNSCKSKKKQRTFGITEKYLIYFKNDEPKAYINLDGVFSEITNSDDLNYFYQITLSNNHKIKFVFWIYNENTFLHLLKILSKFTIQKDFHEKYEISEFLGKGKNSKIYKIKNKLNSQFYAAKCFNKNYLKKNDNYDNVLKEVNILKQLNHKNILEFKEYYETNNSCYIVTEFIDGCELLDIEKFNYSNYNNILNLIMQIINALEYLEKMNLIHFDLKPSNIMIKNPQTNPTVILIDFGSSEYFENLKKNNIRYGTPGYMCPTVLNFLINSKNNLIDNRSDIFSLGIIFYSIIIDSFVFEANTNEEIILKNLKCEDLNFENKYLNNYDYEFIIILKSMLQKDCVNRITLFSLKKKLKKLIDNNIKIIKESKKNNIISSRIIENKKKIEKKYFMSFCRL